MEENRMEFQKQPLSQMYTKSRKYSAHIV
jgi:small GTP-binding protein